MDLTVNRKQQEDNAIHCREQGIVLPTFAQMKDPSLIPEKIKDSLKDIGLWDVHPNNLFRISWKNEPVTHGGGFGGVNYMVIPPELSGIPAKIIGLCGKWFPTGAHKVGATYGCLAPQLVSGQFDPVHSRAVWPSTGNYCRGGAYVSALLGCQSIAILPEDMSKERFEWLSKVAGEVIATHGCESNVKEIFDKCWELKANRTDVRIFNQFEEFGNPLWHYEVTGRAAEEALRAEMKEDEHFAGSVFSSGSAGSLGCGYYLKEKFHKSYLGVAEAFQCPTLLQNGFGDHRIEGIGDKHIPFVHDLKNTDMVIAINDETVIRLMRLFNEPEGIAYLQSTGISSELLSNLKMMGISSIANMVAAIKMARYYELTEKDYVLTMFTDSMELYGSRLKELTEERGPYRELDAHRDFGQLVELGIGNMKELSYYDRKRIHNLKYFTWVEQQGRKTEELNAQWFAHNTYWPDALKMAPEIDALIDEFNDMAYG